MFFEHGFESLLGCETVVLNTDYTDYTDFFGRDTEKSLIEGIWWSLNTDCTDLTDRAWETRIMTL